MAKKPKVNKSQAVRDYLAADPGAMPKDVRTALAKEGIEVSRVLVSTIKGKLNKTGTAKKAAKKPAPVAAEPAAPAVVEKPTNGGTITLEQIKKVAQTIWTLGGIQRVTEVLAVIKELGGVKKFRDLAEAMTVTETATDAIPF
jgi:ribosomal protein S2